MTGNHGKLDVIETEYFTLLYSLGAARYGQGPL